MWGLFAGLWSALRLLNRDCVTKPVDSDGDKINSVDFDFDPISIINTFEAVFENFLCKILG